MVLPHDLLPYAENFYRRFPEEFVALGMPGLEQIFDLRPDGTRSRRVSETESEKTVEITIRRWQLPALVPPTMHPNPYSSLSPLMMASPTAHLAWPSPESSWHAAFAPQSAAMTHVGGVSAWGPGLPQSFHPSCSVNSQVQHPPPSQHLVAPSVNPAESHMASQLARLEAALSTLQPQIEAAMVGQRQAEAASVSQWNHSKPPPTPGSAATHNSDKSSPLRSRRCMNQLELALPNRQKAVSQDAVVKKIEDGQPRNDSVTVQPRKDSVEASSQLRTDSRDADAGAKDKARPTITAVRMAPSAMDPESPRSPGKFSAWK